MMQLSIFEPRARNSDPITSHEAAEKAKSFQARHIALIWDFLDRYRWPDGWTPKQVASMLMMDYTAVQRRGKEMERKGLIVRGPDKRDGQLVWRAK